jgi:hypothetical protein
MPMCPENQPFQILNAPPRPLPPWVQTMLNHIGDMEELKRQLKLLNERLADVREQQKQSIAEESPSFGQKRFDDESSGGKSASAC